MDTAAFDYDLPESAIAQAAIEPRDASRLLVGETLSDSVFADLPSLLTPGDLLVVNTTRVRAARLAGNRVDTGGSVEALLVRRLDGTHWEALMRPARRLRPGIRLSFSGLDGVVESPPVDGVVTLALDPGGADVEDMIDKLGKVPLPPYFHGILDDPERYQTVFAEAVGSAAAPTAALHFTPRLIDAMTDHGVAFASVDLHVGLDTFRPMSVASTEDHSIHTEPFVVSPETVAAVKATRAGGGKVVAVGTTVVRALETAADGNGLEPCARDSSLFITPGYEFRVVDRLITNFHAPRTTLIALVAAFVGPRWREIYAVALERGYRFLSFGDAMLLDRHGH